jgi:DNA-binding response OmpR family regulator
MRLLIIEDDRADADYMARAFRELGHSADLATDGEDGLAHAIAGKYDVIIVDRRLPKLDGLAVISALRSKGINTPALISRRSVRSTIESKGCGRAAMTISTSPIRFQSCWPAQRSWRGPGQARRKWSIASATSSSIVCRVK